MAKKGRANMLAHAVVKGLSCNYTTFFLHFFSFCSTTFFHSSYVIKPLQPNSAIYGAPHWLLQGTVVCTTKIERQCLFCCQNADGNGLARTILPPVQSWAETNENKR